MVDALGYPVTAGHVDEDGHLKEIAITIAGDLEIVGRHLECGNIRRCLLFLIVGDVRGEQTPRFGAIDRSVGVEDTVREDGRAIGRNGADGGVGAVVWPQDKHEILTGDKGGTSGQPEKGGQQGKHHFAAHEGSMVHCGSPLVGM